MLVMTFVKDRDDITPLELEMIRFVNGNIDEMIHMAMDITDIDEDAMDWFFPYGYYKRNKEKCADMVISVVLPQQVGLILCFRIRSLR